MSNLVTMLSSIKAEKNYFIEKLEKVNGYSEQEIAEIEKLNNISVHGQLKELLTTMGKCSGGLIFGDDFYIYRYYRNAGFNIQRQKNLMADEELAINYRESGEKLDLAEEQYFEICGENEHANIFFMYTKDINDIVYEWDENSNTVKRFGTLFEYLIRYRKRLGSYSSQGTSRGDEDPTLFDELTTGRLLLSS
ncbi:SMI1/KNR4 family protein [Acinetobacter sp. LMB-5]|uniref:SMI1/KNR4 family protein n=1 Tax=Acinetobacter sp. LMB-5 TaxID=1609919 RepID=UPI0007616EBC|nr:SMI1/KNR4 family protein [Acinetobacter sp. LMB-5]